jgi:transposase
MECGSGRASEKACPEGKCLWHGPSSGHTRAWWSIGEAAATQRVRSAAKRRWVVERSFAWIGHNRRMSKDYERLCASGEAFVYAAMSRLMLRRLARA